MDEFKIYIDRLKRGKVASLDESLSSEFIDICDEDVLFVDPIVLKGKAYLTEENLILNFDAFVDVRIPCLVCNEMTLARLKVNHFYHTEEVANLSSGVFDFSKVLRDALLLEVPSMIECHGGHCPERELMAKYLKKK